MKKKALYLAGGGARGAYQAGALKAISHILGTKKIPFEMITGVSVGCVNAAVLAEHALDFPYATEKLESLWAEIQSEQIFNASNYELSKSLLRNMSNMVVKQSESGYLLDTKPLSQFISNTIDFDRVNANIQNKHIETLEVISNCYEAQQSISFYQHYSPNFEDWNHPRHRSLRVSFAMEHILGSSALPLFFPPAKIDGFHYGDGGLGLIAPLRGSIRASMNKIMILGNKPLPNFVDLRPKDGNMGVARVLGSMMTSLFLDTLDRDIEMVNHMNEIAKKLSLWKKRHAPWRPIETLHLQPSQDVAQLAQAQYQNIPGFLRFVLNLFGAKNHSGDLLSFLLFEKEFTKKLITLGFEDTMAARDTVWKFFNT